MLVLMLVLVLVLVLVLEKAATLWKEPGMRDDWPGALDSLSSSCPRSEPALPDFSAHSDRFAVRLSPGRPPLPWLTDGIP